MRIRIEWTLFRFFSLLFPYPSCCYFPTCQKVKCNWLVHVFFSLIVLLKMSVGCLFSSDRTRKPSRSKKNTHTHILLIYKKKTACLYYEHVFMGRVYLSYFLCAFYMCITYLGFFFPFFSLQQKKEKENILYMHTRQTVKPRLRIKICTHRKKEREDEGNFFFFLTQTKNQTRAHGLFFYYGSIALH